MQLSLDGKMGCVGLFRRIEDADRYVPAEMPDSGLESPIVSTANTKKTNRAVSVGLPLVLHVHRFINPSKVDDTVISLFAVDVVDQVRRPLSMHN